MIVSPPEPKAAFVGTTPCGATIRFDYPAKSTPPTLAIVRFSQAENRWQVLFRGWSVNAAASRLRWCNLVWAKQHPEESGKAIVITVAREAGHAADA